MYLDSATFRSVVAGTPLVSMDLVVRNRRDEILLGMRSNRPARGYWFVPGGRIMKGEHLDEAFRRLTGEELGVPCDRDRARFLGLFEHHYEDSVFGAEPSTHYVVLAHELELDTLPMELPDDQHSRYRWWSWQEALEAKDVHPYTRAYIESLAANRERKDR
ncbi:GDP-mannose mannosyl hydrolase [Natronospira bacteriovora]|uniref:GDP-mannose mannosyl hydrolase n=1 Tax=Natronospira bacteriovora TaxID=3069753 RepID=A0ABU0W7Y2_9GAMM|nr:GDP-mannose mannosyl hydrolase [Natronospira sp. AB-CW4]MDQ2070143.1 GDP-mannose mannosyl hydrolase [Natronospira sp. AB-CW4]